MIERHDADGALEEGQLILDDVRFRSGGLVALRARHPFGPAGRAGGVEHDRRRLICRLREGLQRAVMGAQCLVGLRTAAWTDAEGWGGALRLCERGLHSGTVVV